MSQKNETIFEVGMKFDYYSPAFNIRRVAASTQQYAIGIYLNQFQCGYTSNMMLTCKQVKQEK